MKELIEKGLNENVNLSEEEYREKVIKADNQTKSHGVEGKAPVSEALRHKRIQSNFYGIALNFLSILLGEITNQSTLLSQQNAMLYELCKKEGINVDELFKQQ